MLHPTSFPSPFGIGDLGASAYQFIDFLHRTDQQLWQVLPLGPVAYGNSPYMCYSSMAGNPMLISLELLQKQGFLSADDLSDFPTLPLDWVDYEQVADAKLPLLLKAAEAFKENATVEQRQTYETFCASRAFWLNDFAFFMALKEAHGGTGWYEWEPAIAKRQTEAMREWHEKLNDEIFYQKYLQFEFFRQWSEARAYANDFGIQIIGDIPIYVAHDSADVWAFPENFYLEEETGRPALMAGVPPDYFSNTGQLWGNPLYNWELLQKTKFEWWVQRFRAMLEYVDLIRLDHFRGFCAYWAVPQGETTAINGEWLEAPGETLFDLLEQEMGQLPFLAEDLGVITPDVEALREKHGFPGMKILQFAFGSNGKNPFLPFNYDRNCVVYTGTHDNDTTVGWFHQLTNDQERSRVLFYLNCSPDDVHWALIRLAMGSVAERAIFPLQDIMGLGTETRMNYPGKPSGNWGWRYQSHQLTQELGDRLHQLTEIHGRSPETKEHRNF